MLFIPGPFLTLPLLVIYFNLLLLLCRVDACKRWAESGEAHMEGYMESLSPLEKQLIDSHGIITIRGKKGRAVPVLIPPDVKRVLELLANEEVRKRFGIQENPYLFANFCESLIILCPSCMAWENIIVGLLSFNS